MRAYIVFGNLGSAYVFRSVNGISGWSEVSKLMASDGGVNAFFGFSVSVWGNVIAAGASGDQTAKGVYSGERVV